MKFKYPMLDSIKQILFPLYLKLYISRRVKAGVALVDVSRFGAKQTSDICDHLLTINLVLSLYKPKSILELGTRGGESTRVISRYCEINGISGTSIDLASAPIWMNNLDFWNHIVGDDCEIGEYLNRNHKWPNSTPLDDFDFIFLDTSHEYEHTLRELELFFPLMKKGGLILLHDTNLTRSPTRRLDGEIAFGWDNARGVTRALEEYFQISLNERIFHSQEPNEKCELLIHYPWNNGLTIIQKK